MELFKLFGTIAVDNDKANRAIDETTDKGESAEGRLSGAFKKIGAAVATYFAVDQIVTFGQQIVETAANVAAESSAFEQIMGSYSDQAKAKMGEVADATGVVDTRLTGYMTSMTAKFKGLGFDIDEATTLAADGLTLASDAAAFWDKSLEDSMSGLNSFINGSYEGGEAIGLFANDTQMAAFAVEQGIIGATKEWANLDEATKQATRLEYAQNMYELSGATGQAAKEADQWANVTANLKEQWRQFQAIIGTPLLEALTPVLKQVGDAADYVITTLQDAPNLLTGFQTVFSTLGQTISQQAPQMVTAAGQLMSGIGQGISENLPLIAQSALGIAQGLGQGIRENLPTLISSGLEMLQGLSQGFRESLPTLLSAAGEIVLGLVQGLMESLPTFIQKAPEIINNFAMGINESVPVILQKGGEILMAIGSGLVAAIPTLISNIPQILQAIWNAFVAFNWLGLGRTLITGILNGVKAMGGSLVSGVKGIFTNIQTSATNIWNMIKSGVGNIANGLKTAVINAFNALKTNVGNIFNGVKSAASSIWNGIKSAISSVVNGIKTTVSNVFNSVKSTATSVWNGIKSAIQRPIESARDLVKGAIDKIKGFFNFNISWPHIPLPHFSISPSGWSVGDLLKGSIPSIGISWYAKGGIFDTPTIFPTIGGFKGVGEAGPEAVTPIDALLDYVRTAVSEQTGGMAYDIRRLYDMMADYMPQLLAASDKQLVLDTGALVGATSWDMDRELGNIARRRERGQ